MPYLSMMKDCRKAGNVDFFPDKSREKKHQAVKITGSRDDLLPKAELANDGNKCVSICRQRQFHKDACRDGYLACGLQLVIDVRYKNL